MHAGARRSLVVRSVRLPDGSSTAAEAIRGALASAGAVWPGPWPRPPAMPLLRSPPLIPEIIDVTAAVPPRARPTIKSPPRRRPGSPSANQRRFLHWVAALQVVGVVAILLGRAEVVRVLPETASLFRVIGLPVNLRGLAFAGLRTHTERQDGVAVLIVEGRIESDSPVAVPVPPLRFALRDASGAELYAWSAAPDAALLGPGESLPFRTRLASPPARVNDVVVRFLQPSDG
jgi:hypothetical protein